MNPRKLAKQECANFWDGDCLSITITSKLEQYVDNDLPKGRCIVDTKNCKYFEDIIIRQIRNNKNSTPQEEKAIIKYEEMLMASSALRKCNECHRKYPSSFHNEKYCSDCKKKRKLKSNREYKNRLKSRKST